MRLSKFTPLALAALLLTSACATTRPPVQPPTPTPTVTPIPNPAVPGMTQAQADPLIIAAYRDLLFRVPDPFGFDFYRSRLMDGRMGDASMREDIKASPEYKALHATPTPTPTPPPVIEVIGGRIPGPVMATIRQFASLFPLPRGDFPSKVAPEAWMDSQLRHGWVKHLAEHLAFTYGPDWGQKRRDMGSPISGGSIALRVGSSMHVWDILQGAGTGLPVLSEGEYFWVTDQMFWPVTPKDHFNIVAPSDRPTIDTPFRGISSFDLAPRVHNGDLRWIDEVLVPNKLTGRMFVYANGSGGTRLWRNADTGLVQTETLLMVFEKRGLKGVFVLLVGTGSCCDNWSREQALDFVRRANAVFVRHPSAVAALQCGNENSHSIEAPYMTDPEFLKECDALIDKRFPLAWGAGHGGEPVFSAGGSYLAHHGDRGLTPDQNGSIMAEAQRLAKRKVVDDEALGITEPDRVAGRQRTADPEYARRQLEAVRKYGLGGSTLHIDAGLTCNVDELGPVQRAAIAIFAGGQSEDEEYEWPLAA